MYLLTLFPFGHPRTGTRILIPNIEEATIIRGINKMQGMEPNHYELYAKEIQIVKSDEPCGSYKDGSIWDTMCWETEKIETLED